MKVKFVRRNCDLIDQTYNANFYESLEQAYIKSKNIIKDARGRTEGYDRSEEIKFICGVEVFITNVNGKYFYCAVWDDNNSSTTHWEIKKDAREMFRNFEYFKDYFDNQNHREINKEGFLKGE